jgi:hypothetical protein
MNGRGKSKTLRDKLAPVLHLAQIFHKVTNINLNLSDEQPLSNTLSMTYDNIQMYIMVCCTKTYKFLKLSHLLPESNYHAL